MRERHTLPFLALPLPLCHRLMPLLAVLQHEGERTLSFLALPLPFCHRLMPLLVVLQRVLAAKGGPWVSLACLAALSLSSIGASFHSGMPRWYIQQRQRTARSRHMTWRRACGHASPGPHINIPDWVFCVSWCANSECWVMHDD